jgi:hypothetical protein
VFDGSAYRAVVPAVQPGRLLELGYDTVYGSFFVCVVIADDECVEWSAGDSELGELPTVDGLVTAAAQYRGGCLSVEAEAVIGELRALESRLLAA